MNTTLDSLVRALVAQEGPQTSRSEFAWMLGPILPQSVQGRFAGRWRVSA